MRCSELLEPSKAKKLTLLLIFLLLFSLGYGDTVIYLKKRVFLTKGSINLSDIATVKSDNQNFKSFLEGIYISDFSEKTVITAQQIKNTLEKNYINLNLVKIVGNQVYVQRKKISITQEYLQDKITYHLYKKYKNIKIKGVRCPFKPFEAKTTPETKLFVRSKSNSHIYLTATILSDEKMLKQIHCTVKYTQMINAVVAKKDLMRGQLITENDIEIRKIEFRRGVITDIDVVRGAKVKTFIKKGKPIKASMIEIDFPVKKKDYVRVIYNRNGIKIEITGQALESGVIGQSIKVKNVSTGKLLRCKVIGRNTVLFISGY